MQPITARPVIFVSAPEALSFCFSRLWSDGVSYIKCRMYRYKAARNGCILPLLNQLLLILGVQTDSSHGEGTSFSFSPTDTRIHRHIKRQEDTSRTIAVPSLSWATKRKDSDTTLRKMEGEFFRLWKVMSTIACNCMLSSTFLFLISQIQRLIWNLVELARDKMI